MNLTELQALLEDTTEEAPASSPAPVKLVPKVQDPQVSDHPSAPQAATVQERLHEIELAQKLGYLLCKCTWPPQIMVMAGEDHIYRCRRCSRVREM